MHPPEHLTESDLVASVETNLVAMFRDLTMPDSLGRRFDEVGYMQLLTHVQGALFNSVVGANLDAAAIDEAIDQVLARGRSRGVPMLWWVGPVTRPTDLGDRLQQRGFALATEMQAMILDLLDLDAPEPLPSRLTIEEVRDPEANADWTAILTRGFGMPDAWRAPLSTWVRTAATDPDTPLRNYLGLYEGEPVAAASAYLGPHVAGIYNVATLERARGKGIGRAMTLAPLHDARTQGYRYSMLHASEMGRGVYRKIGYRDVGTMRQYEWSPDSNRGWS